MQCENGETARRPVTGGGTTGREAAAAEEVTGGGWEARGDWRGEERAELRPAGRRGPGCDRRGGANWPVPSLTVGREGSGERRRRPLGRPEVATARESSGGDKGGRRW